MHEKYNIYVHYEYIFSKDTLVVPTKAEGNINNTLKCFISCAGLDTDTEGAIMVQKLKYKRRTAKLESH